APNRTSGPIPLLRQMAVLHAVPKMSDMASSLESKDLRRERIAASPRWDGERFRNTHSPPRGNVPMPTMKDFLCGGERRVPRAPLPTIDPRDTWRHAPDSGLRATWLGHSTGLLE